jgi:hypothetical protein
VNNNPRANTRAFLITGLVIATCALLLFLLSSRRYNWNENYREDPSLPYGSSLLLELIKESLTPNQTFIYVADSLRNAFVLDSLAPASTYLFIGREYYADSADVAFLSEFVKAGHTAIFISHTFNNRLFSTFLDDFDADYEFIPWDVQSSRLVRYTDTSTVLTLTSAPELKHEIKNVYDQRVVDKVWAAFPPSLVTKDGQELLYLGETDNGGSNLVRFFFGKGSVYLHSTPLAFSNYWLRTKPGFDYASVVLKAIGSGDLIWDGYNREFRFNRGDFTPPRYTHEDGILAFILANEGLKAAWYLLLATAALYLLFGARRTQRPVPVVIPPRNTSIAFAETIGTMYRQENEHKKLTRLKMRLFKAHVRERYGLSTQLVNENRDVFISRLAERSHCEEKIIRDIFEIYDIIEGRDDRDGSKLIRFHNALSQFTHHAR